MSSNVYYAVTDFEVYGIAKKNKNLDILRGSIFFNIEKKSFIIQLGLNYSKNVFE